MSAVTGPFSLERVVNAVEKVRVRLLKAAAALRAAKIPYAVAGGNAVALWVSRVDEAAVRNTQDVDMLLRRSDFAAAKSALESAGFVYRHVGGIDAFLDGPAAKARDAVRIVFDGLGVDDSEDAVLFRVASLDHLARLELNNFRDESRTHLRDLIEVGLIGADWIGRLPPALGERLRQLLDTPEG